jgi:hypothetical protein
MAVVAMGSPVDSVARRDDVPWDAVTTVITFPVGRGGPDGDDVPHGGRRDGVPVNAVARRDDVSWDAVTTAITFPVGRGPDGDTVPVGRGHNVMLPPWDAEVGR